MFKHAIQQSVENERAFIFYVFHVPQIAEKKACLRCLRRAILFLCQRITGLFRLRKNVFHKKKTYTRPVVDL